MDFERTPHEFDENLPLIYMWEIKDLNEDIVGRYVGQTIQGLGKRVNRYVLRVGQVLTEKLYDKKYPAGFRKVHRALANAARNNFHVTLSVLCNVPTDQDINSVEQSWIKSHHCKGPQSWQLNG